MYPTAPRTENENIFAKQNKLCDGLRLDVVMRKRFQFTCFVTTNTNFILSVKGHLSESHILCILSVRLPDYFQVYVTFFQAQILLAAF